MDARDMVKIGIAYDMLYRNYYLSTNRQEKKEEKRSKIAPEKFDCTLSKSNLL
jgi:hypothetical protein